MSLVENIFFALKTSIQAYQDTKTYALKTINPYIRHFDLIDILIVWTIFVIIIQRVLATLRRIHKQGYKRSIVDGFLDFARKIPFVERQIEKELDKAKRSLDEDVNKHRDNKTFELPKKSLSDDEITNKLTKWNKRDKQFYSDLRISGTLYYPESDAKHLEFLQNHTKNYLYSNPLHFDLFPSVAQIEAEVISMVKKMYNGDDNVCGLLTSGGTESIMLAMLAYREQGRKRGIAEPEILAPVTAHAAFNKAAFYYGINIVMVPVDPKTGIVDPRKLKRYITSNTVCIVGSMPNYPYGTYDPIEELGEIARKAGVGFHVDCCLGGFLVPFHKGAGIDLPLFDFRNPNVTSISVDPHKYGVAPKGVSVVLYRNRDLRAGCIFSITTWPGGIYATPTHAGSRSGAPAVGAWISMLHFGYEGYQKLASSIMNGVKKAGEELKQNADVQVIGSPNIAALAFISKNPSIDIFDVLDKLSSKGWHVSAVQIPSGIHLSVTAYNLPRLPEFVKDVKWAIEDLKKNPPTKKSGMAQLYGSAATMPDSLVNEGAKLIIDSMLKI